MSKISDALEMTCFDCENCNYICEGDFICDADPTRMVLSEWGPTEDFFWCGGKSFCERSRT